MTHGNIVATAAAVMTIIPKIGSGDVFLAYLPLAHVFELEAEVCYTLSSLYDCKNVNNYINIDCNGIYVFSRL